MSDKPTKFGFYRGDVLLGYIMPTHDDFPWHYGTFEPSLDFHAVAHLFDAELRLLQESKGTSVWDKAYDVISSAGLRLDPLGPGKTINNPLVHIQGDIVWWR